MAVHGKHVHPQLGVEKAFGNAFRSLRENKGISQERVAFDSGFDRTTVSLIERGLVSPKLGTVVKMCAAINCLPSEVMKTMEKSSFFR